MVGKTISHYTVFEHLSGWGTRVVYKDEDTRLKRTVALKFLPAAFSIDPDAKARFRHKAEAASALDHPNICVVHNIDETAHGQIFISMACHEEETMKKKLAAAHETGTVHRNIKPANIMVTEERALCATRDSLSQRN